MAAALKQVQMTVEEFSKIPDSLIQRDTATRGRFFSKKPGHLSAFHPMHIRVAMCVTKKGKKFKLDGHTRMFCIKENLLEWPKGQKLFVDVWTVEDEDEAMLAYMHFDGFSTAVHETGNDKLFGAFRYHKFVPRVPYMFKEVGILSAVTHMVFEKRWGQSKLLTHIKLLEPWMDTIRVIDAAMDPWHNSQYFPSPFTAAMLCIVRAYGKDGIAWIQKFHDMDMSRTSKSVDGVYRAHDLLQQFKNPVMSPMQTEGGRRQTKGRRIAEIAPKIVFCFEQQHQGKRFPVSVGKGKRHWQGLLSLPDWWTETIGDYDHPELRTQLELEVED